MSLHERITEVEMPREPLTRMAEILFDDRPAAFRGSMQVVIAVLIGVLMGNSLHIVL